MGKMKEEHERHMSSAETAGRVFYDAVAMARANRPDLLEDRDITRLVAADPRAAVELLIGRAYLQLVSEYDAATARIKDLESGRNRGEQE